MGISEALGIKKMSKERYTSQRIIDQSPSRAEEFKQKIYNATKSAGSAVKSGIVSGSKLAVKEMGKQFKKTAKPKTITKYVRVNRSGKRKVVRTIRRSQPKIQNAWSSPNLFGENNRKKNKSMDLF